MLRAPAQAGAPADRRPLQARRPMPAREKEIRVQRHEVVFVDGVRTPFGRAGEKGMYWNTRADDLIVKAMVGLLDRNPDVPKDRIDDVAIAATTQQGDKGLPLGRTAALLAGLPK